jgi:four helix bundle protein
MYLVNKFCVLVQQWGLWSQNRSLGSRRQTLISKLSIALKEANETQYWLSLLKDSEYIDKKMFESIYPDNEELVRLLVSSIKTAKRNGN